MHGNSSSLQCTYDHHCIHYIQTWKELIEKEMMELNRVYSIAIHENMALSPTVGNSDEEDAIYTVPPDDDESEFKLVHSGI